MGPFSQLATIGCGTIGLPLAIAFASRGWPVVGIDTSPERIANLRAGKAVDFETEFASALSAALAANRLTFDTSLAVHDGRRVYIVAVPTPAGPDQLPQLQNIDAVTTSIGKIARDGDLVVIRSTVPVGTTRRVAAQLRQSGRNIHVVSCPDRSLTGRSFTEQFDIPNIIGALNAESAQIAAEVFAALGDVIAVASPETAEAIKLFANVQRDITFAIANEFALTCEALGLDFAEIRRVGGQGYARFSLARPGPVGGSCLSKDAFLLANPSGARPAAAKLMLAARAVNDSLCAHIVDLISQHIGSAKGRAVAVLGMAFKGDPETSDRRGSFGVALVEALEAELGGLDIRIWEPTEDTPDAMMQAIAEADAVVIANDHKVFTNLDPAAIADVLRPGAMILDLCGRLPRANAALPNKVVQRLFGSGVLRV